MGERWGQPGRHATGMSLSVSDMSPDTRPALSLYASVVRRAFIPG
jgi:hypothetical protein